MKKLIAMIGAAVMSFGLFADSFNNTYTVPTDFKVGPTNIVGYTDNGQTSIYNAAATDKVLWIADNFPTNKDDETSYEQPAEVALDTVDSAEVNVLKIEADTAYPMLRLFNKVTQTDVGEGKYTKMPMDIGTLGLFADTKIKLSASEEAPQDFNGKVAVWLQVIPAEEGVTEGSTNLMVTCGQLSSLGVLQGTTNIAIAADGVTVKPEEWHRITIRSIEQIAKGKTVPGFVIYVDGKPAKAVGDYALPTDLLTDEAKKLAKYDELFASASSEAATAQTLESVGIAGNGSLRSIDLTDGNSAPEFAVDPTEVTITWNKGVTGFTVDGQTINVDEEAGETNIVIALPTVAKDIEVTPIFETNPEYKLVGFTLDDAALLDDEGVAKFNVARFSKHTLAIEAVEAREGAQLYVWNKGSEQYVAVGAPSPRFHAAYETLLGLMTPNPEEPVPGMLTIGDKIKIVLLLDEEADDFGDWANIWPDVEIDLNGHYLRAASTWNPARGESTDYSVFNNGTAMTITDSVGGGAVYGIIDTEVPANSVKAFSNHYKLTIEAVDDGKDEIKIYGGIETAGNEQGVEDLVEVTLKGGLYNPDKVVPVEEGAIVNLGAPAGSLKWSAGPDEDGYWSLVSDEVITFTVEQVENVTAVVTVDGKEVTGSEGTYTAKPDLEVVVTYNANEGYVFSDKTTSVTLEPATSAQDLAIAAPAQVKAVGKAKAKKGTVLFLTLQDAIEDTQATGDVVLMDNVTIDSWIAIDKEVTLDLAGFAVNSATEWKTGDAMFAVKHGGNFTVKDTSTEGTGVIDAVPGKVMVVVKMTQNGADNDDTKVAAFTLTSGKLNGYEYGISGNGNAGRGNTSVTINGGTILVASAHDAAADKESCGIYNPQNGTLTIAGGSIEADVGVYVKSGAAVVTTTGGTIKGRGTAGSYEVDNDGVVYTGAAFAIDNANYVGGAPSATIAGGTFISQNGAAIEAFAREGKTKASNFVTGGSFTGQVKIDDAIAGGTFAFGPFEAGKAQTLVDAVAKIGTVNYASLAAAIAVVGDGDTIKMLADVPAANGIRVPGGKNFTVDFDGHSYLVEKPGAGSPSTKTQAFQLLEGSTIVFKNGTIGCTEDNKTFTWTPTSDIKGVAFIIQNYANLTLEGMTINGENIAKNGGTAARYLISNNSGAVVLNNTTVNANEGDFAFDTCKYKTYTAPTVEVKGTSAINGDVELSGGNLTLTAGTLNGALVRDESKQLGTITKAAGFTAEPPEGYKWVNGVLTKIEYATLTIKQVDHCTVAVSNADNTAEIETGAKFDKDLAVKLNVYRVAAEGYELDNCAATEEITMTADYEATAAVKEKQADKPSPAPGSDVKVDEDPTDPGTFIVTPTGSSKNVVIQNVKSGNVLKVDGSAVDSVMVDNADGVTFKVMNKNFDITGACEGLTENTFSTELDGTKSVTVDDEIIKVEPEIATTDASGEKVEPMVITDTAVTIQVKTIPGLTYQLVKKTALDGEGEWTAVGDPVDADAARAGLTAEKTKDPASFYKIKVAK